VTLQSLRIHSQTLAKGGIVSEFQAGFKREPDRMIASVPPEKIDLISTIIDRGKFGDESINGWLVIFLKEHWNLWLFLDPRNQYLVIM